MLVKNKISVLSVTSVVQSVCPERKAQWLWRN